MEAGANHPFIHPRFRSDNHSLWLYEQLYVALTRTTKQCDNIKIYVRVENEDLDIETVRDRLALRWHRLFLNRDQGDMECLTTALSQGLGRYDLLPIGPIQRSLDNDQIESLFEKIPNGK